MRTYTALSDVQTLWRSLAQDEQARVTALIPIIEDTLRQYAQNLNRDLDEMIDSGRIYESVVKSVVVDVVKRYVTSMADESAPVTQASQSALGYSVSGTYLVPGGGVFIKNNELARLGLKRQRIGVIDFDRPARHHCDPV